MKKNSIIFGLLTGLAVPFVGFALMLFVNETLNTLNIYDRFGEVFQFSNRLQYLLAICLNLIPFQIFRNRRMDYALRGIIFPTLILSFTWLIYFRLI